MKNNILSKLFGKKTELKPTEPFRLDLSHFNRYQRRKGLFVIKNNVNGLYCRQTNTEGGKNILFQDVPLKKSSFYMFDNVQNVVYLMKHNKPELDLTVQCYDPKLKRIIE